MKGVARSEADSIVDKLKASVLEHEQGHVGAHVLRGPRNFSIKVPVHADSIREVLSKWREYLKADGTTYNDNEISVAIEKHPEDRKR